MVLTQEDDFVLTISDHDNDVLESEPEVVAPSSPAIQNKKRKRVDHDAEELDDRKKGGSKSQKKKQKKPKSGPSDDVHALADDEQWAATGEDDGTMNPDFDFVIGDLGQGRLQDLDAEDMDIMGDNVGGRGDKKAADIDEIIARRRQKKADQIVNGAVNEQVASDADKDMEEDDANDGSDDDDELLAEDGFGMGVTANEHDPEDEDSATAVSPNSDDEASSQSPMEFDNESIASPVPHPDDMPSNASSADDGENAAERARREAFFAPEESSLDAGKASKNGTSASFQNMSLSRPVLKGLNAVGFTSPTPIQAKTIPIALLGKDVVGGAVTGSGKTAAFLVPILERLLYRPKTVATSRVAILMPTRELAVQCHEVAQKLSAYTDVTFCRLVGGFSLREQESELRKRPDVIIATPGRFIDHMRNSASFTVDSLEILVLDEADRMLEDGFADELNEILTTIPKSRQTMLFSATMTDSVDKLIRLGMTRPVRLLVDARKQTVATLVQEFVRLRAGREDKRLACLMLLCSTSFTDRVIVFFRQKKEAHRVRVVFALAGLKAAELHGSMSQEQRMHSVESFRQKQVSFLLATDLASRGLDIKGVETVINYEAPQSHEIYLHRVGRTARAGRMGRSCTIAADSDRKVVKAAVKAGRAQGAKIVSRLLDAGTVDGWAQRLDGWTEEVEAVMKEERDERQLAQAEMQVQRGSNILTHQQEIMARPKRTWFESEKDKHRAKVAGKTELNGPGVGPKGTKRKPGKLSGKEKKRLEDRDGRAEGRVWKKGSRERQGGAGKDTGKVPGKKGKGRTGGSKDKGRAKMTRR
ncbi:MAG: nucleolar DEAD-box protein required for synthesis of 60S ribosomal subunit [Thelocarpon superellum]|nr:MAG: nucleolar DEAD-box protein required for synthesis of 60S ribosomal subunit [Thelocarpon superellum]